MPAWNRNNVNASMTGNKNPAHFHRCMMIPRTDHPTGLVSHGYKCTMRVNLKAPPFSQWGLLTWATEVAGQLTGFGLGLTHDIHQFLNAGRRLGQGGLFVGSQANLDYLLHAAGSQFHRHTDAEAVDAVLPF